MDSPSQHQPEEPLVPKIPNCRSPETPKTQQGLSTQDQWEKVNAHRDTWGEASSVGVPLKSPMERGVSSQLEHCISPDGIDGPCGKSLSLVSDHNEDGLDEEMRTPGNHQCEEPPVPTIPNCTCPERRKPQEGFFPPQDQYFPSGFQEDQASASQIIEATSPQPTIEKRKQSKKDVEIPAQPDVKRFKCVSRDVKEIFTIHCKNIPATVSFRCPLKGRTGRDNTEDDSLDMDK
ncbi:hypothetical protein B0H13DRAFT_1927630 [Mycena leptocephala]|nr:hypothetical protein B0H13DRAFT_1927630 [Mycena leptocephala]